MNIDDYGDAICALVDNDIPLKDVIRRYREIAVARSMPGDIPKPTMTEQRHADIVGLIEAEMGEVACGNHVGAERLACVIEDRMGYETPKKSCLPDITQGKWHKRLIPDTNDLAIYADDEEYGIPIVGVVGGNLRTRPYNANLIAAAPDLAEALKKMSEEVRVESVRADYAWSEILAMSDAALEKAGVDL